MTGTTGSWVDDTSRGYGVGWAVFRWGRGGGLEGGRTRWVIGGGGGGGTRRG